MALLHSAFLPSVDHTLAGRGAGRGSRDAHAGPACPADAPAPAPARVLHLRHLLQQQRPPGALHLDVRRDVVRDEALRVRPLPAVEAAGEGVPAAPGQVPAPGGRRRLDGGGGVGTVAAGRGTCVCGCVILRLHRRPRSKIMSRFGQVLAIFDPL